MSVVLKGEFFKNGRSLTFLDGGIVWTFNATTNTLTGVAGAAPGTVDTANSPAAGEFAKFTDADTIEGRTVAETKSDLSLGNVDNTSDANKPVSTAQQTALDLKANIASPTLTGVPAAPTAAANTNTTQIATTAYVQTEIADLIGAAPGVLDTLGEISDALADDASFAATITTALAGKQPLDADLTAIAALVSAADKLPYATAAQTWALTDLSAYARTYLDDANEAALKATLNLEADVDYPALATFNDHSARHESAGADPIKLDDFAAPDDNTDLNASTSTHGLMQKYPGGTSNFLRSDGTFAAPVASAGDFDSVLTGSSTISANKVRTIGGRLDIADGGGILVIEDLGAFALV